jgi:prepilin-type N-terminal cleavage/methylation domain-containing protein
MNVIERLKKNSKDKNGFSLLELVLAVAIFSFSSFALATMIIDSNISTRLSTDKTDALFYAKEGVEAVRSIRDNDWTAWASTTDGNYGLSINTVGSSSAWIFNGASDLIDNKYTRTVNIATDPVVPTSKDVTVNIAWDLTPGRIASTTLLTIFSNWPDVINSSLAVPRGLVSYYSFDDAGAGTAGDSIGGNDGTVTGATATTSVKGIANQAYSFDGSGDFVTITGYKGVVGTNPVSVSVWFKTSPSSAYKFLYMWGDDSSGANYMYFNTDRKLQFGIYGSCYIPVPGLDNDEWHHAVTTYNGTLMRFYVDGNEQTSYGSPMSCTLSVAPQNDLKMGVYKDGEFGPFAGSMDNVRIYSRALTADEVTTIYNAEKP